MLVQNTYGDSVVFSLKNQTRLNGFVAQAVQEELMESLDDNFNLVLLDLCGIKFIDSAAFSMLMELHNKASELEKDFYLMNVSEEVNELLSLVLLDNVLKIKTATPELAL